MAQFNRVDVGHPPLNPLDLSHDRLFTAPFGRLYPVAIEEVLPGDSLQIGVRHVVRLPPLVTPPLHEINTKYHAFFVPNRLIQFSAQDPLDIDIDWEEFITGGVDGDDAQTLPVWTWADLINVLGSGGALSPEEYFDSLLEQMGIPYPANSTGGVGWDDGAAPIRFPNRAFNRVFNDYFRDETYQAERSLDDLSPANVSWRKDYFTSVLPWQQRGTSPALPVTITGSSAADFTQAASDPYWTNIQPGDGQVNDLSVDSNTAGDNKIISRLPTGGDGSTIGVGNARQALSHNVVPGSSLTAATFDVADLRLVTQLQRSMERAARVGGRYTEWLRGMFGRSPRDERLQRPEYIGGAKIPVIVSEVLQTSESGSGTPQGNMAGHGISVDAQFLGRYRAVEHGFLVIVAYIAPRPMYTRGHRRHLLRRTRWDYYQPALASLSEQPVYRAELDAAHVTGAGPLDTYGYQGRWDEYRYVPSYVSGLFRPNDQLGTFGQMLDTWHMAREYAGGPLPNAANQRLLNTVDGYDQDLRRVFSFQGTPGEYYAAAYWHVGVMLRAGRPMPEFAIPGRIDHIYGG